jgi:hypothetical protein
MDDLELEARLRTRLHSRFDAATPSPDLASTVRQAMTTQPRRVGFTLRMRSIPLGWAAIAAAIVLVVSVIGIGKVLGPTGPGGAPTPTPAPVVAGQRVFVVLPPAGAVPDKASGGLAIEVIDARIRALGIGNFTSAEGYAIELFLPAGGPSDETIRTVLTATGDVHIVPLPAADYGSGKRSATLGAPLPKAEPALFGWEGVASVSSAPTAEGPQLTLVLKSAAAQAFGDYTAAHIGETFAIVVDGRVALLPLVEAAISDGTITIAASRDAALQQTAAVLAGGELPEAWRGATSPVLISRAHAEAAALTATLGGTIQDTNLDVELPAPGAALRVVWNVDVLVPECPANESCVLAAGRYLAKVDAAGAGVELRAVP